MVMSEAMTCRDAAASVDDFVDGNLPSDRRQPLASHLRECSECAQVMRDARCVRRLLQRMPHEQMPDPMKRKLLDELRRSRTPRRSARSATLHDVTPESRQHPPTGNSANSTPDIH